MPDNHLQGLTIEQLIELAIAADGDWPGRNMLLKEITGLIFIGNCNLTTYAATGTLVAAELAKRLQRPRMAAFLYLLQPD